MASLYAIPYNGTTMTGCDSLTENCHQYYDVDPSLQFPFPSYVANILSPAT